MPLTKLLAAKSFAELLFVSALAAVYYFNTAPPTYRGWSQLTAGGVAGWAVERKIDFFSAAAEGEERRVEVQLELNGRLAANATADLPRPDVAAHLRRSRPDSKAPPDERCGFEFDLRDLELGDYDAQVYAVHRPRDGRAARLTLIPVGPRLQLRVEDGGRIVARDGRAEGSSS